MKIGPAMDLGFVFQKLFPGIEMVVNSSHFSLLCSVYRLMPPFAVKVVTLVSSFKAGANLPFIRNTPLCPW